MIDAAPNHLNRLLALKPPEFRIGKLFRTVAPAKRLLPDEQPHAVAQTQHRLALFVVTPADEVAALLFYHAEIGTSQELRNRRTEFRMTLMTIPADQLQRFPVQQKTAVSAFDFAHSELNRNSISGNDDTCGVQFRRFRRPEFDPGNPADRFRRARMNRDLLRLRRSIEPDFRSHLLRNLSAERKTKEQQHQLALHPPE